MRRLSLGLLTTCFAGWVMAAGAQQCTTQSQMRPQEKAALVETATQLATAVQANDSSAVRQRTIAEVAQDFAGITNSIATVAPHLRGAMFEPNTLWILDATRNKVGTDGKPEDVQVFCNLNGGWQATSFSLQALPAGRYGLAILDAPRAQPPYQLVMLLREEAGSWRLAGFFPRPTTAAGHDGVWYWKAARADAAKKQSWNAWLQYGEAERLLRPAAFVSSSHLEQLQEEQSKAAPTALSGGVSSGTPLIIKARDGAEYRFTGIGPDDSLGGDRIDVAIHYTAEPIPDPVAARARNQRVASAFVSAYPELRDAFHGIWVFAESPGANPFATEEPIASLR